jgi:hypothetical protein
MTSCVLPHTAPAAAISSSSSTPDTYVTSGWCTKQQLPVEGCFNLLFHTPTDVLFTIALLLLLM